MKPFSYASYVTSTSVPDVMDSMQRLQQELDGTDMSNLQAFNQTYYIITKNVYQKIGTGFFENDNNMERVDVNFANYYFTALQNFLHEKHVAPAWKELFIQCRKDSLYQFVYMAMGVNAHVNNDLGLSLHEVIDDPDTFEADFLKVNTIIDDSLQEVIASLQERARLVNILKHELIGIYAFILKELIRNWRQNAWKTFLLLRENQTDLSKVEFNAGVIATSLTQIKKLHDIHRIRQVVI